MVSVMEMVRLAKEQVENLSPADVAREVQDGEVVLVDVREPEETAGGVIPGALLAPRGMLEFHADPATKYHLAPLRPDRRVILYCAAGSRSALGARALKELGYANVAHLDGGVEAWRHEGRPLAAVGEVAR
ncbi:MAG TPA: rhodanese-like domain-containing protein [Trueperaceae bacterium]|nr:rhodanese-like domain-containing protein [Trueperaceae bacterium]